MEDDSIDMENDSIDMECHLKMTVSIWKMTVSIWKMTLIKMTVSTWKMTGSIWDRLSPYLGARGADGVQHVGGGGGGDRARGAVHAEEHHARASHVLVAGHEREGERDASACIRRHQDFALAPVLVAHHVIGCYWRERKTGREREGRESEGGRVSVFEEAPGFRLGPRACHIIGCHMTHVTRV
jgi:hypothetical protein